MSNTTIVLGLVIIYIVVRSIIMFNKNNSNKSIDYDKLFNNFYNPALLLDNKDIVLDLNKSFLDTFNIKESEILGVKFKEVIENELLADKNDQISWESENKEFQIDQALLKGNKKVRLKSIPVDNNKRFVIFEINKDEVENLAFLLRNSRRKIKDLHNTALKMQKVRTEQEIYDLTVKAAENILDYDLCTLDIVEGDNLIVKATSSNIIAGESISSKLDSENLATYVYKNKCSLLTKDIQKKEYANPTSDKYHSALTIPVGDRGIFQAVSTKINEFSQEDLELVELLISHTLSALQRLELDQQIRYLGFHDNLTDLYNRHYIKEEFIRLNTKRQLPLSIIIGDLDALKLINDIFGHEEGDKYIKKASRLLKRCIRDEDILGRWGGDEFIIILPMTSDSEANNIIERIKNESKKTINEKIPISISLGKATKNKDDKKDINKIIEEADYLMYKNKSLIYKDQDNPIIDMIKKKFENDEIDQDEIYRLDSLLELIKK
ncbi:MAG: diguanylate cyclase [Halanaerobiales bacterium]|nr:diguanylate cyclase [Halanaerobiales bacterium]